MTTYAIGNLQGGHATLSALLDSIQFDSEQDVLWFTGNFVTQHQGALATLRFIKQLGKSAVSILGNNEIELLAVAEGIHQQDDNLYAEILNAEDREELLKWLRQRPLMHYDAKSNCAAVHAGIPAEWTLNQARTFAIEVESALSFGNHKAFLENICGKPPRRWNAKLHGWRRLHFIVSAFTQMQQCNEKGYMDFGIQVPDTEYIPWYQQSNRATANINIIFGRGIKMTPDEQFAGIYPVYTNNEDDSRHAILKISTTPEMIFQ